MTVAQLEQKVTDLNDRVEHLNQMIAAMEKHMWKALDNHATHIEKMLDAWKRHEREHSDSMFKVTID